MQGCQAIRVPKGHQEGRDESMGLLKKPHRAHVVIVTHLTELLGANRAQAD